MSVRTVLQRASHGAGLAWNASQEATARRGDPGETGDGVTADGVPADGRARAGRAGESSRGEVAGGEITDTADEAPATDPLSSRVDDYGNLLGRDRIFARVLAIAIVGGFLVVPAVSDAWHNASPSSLFVLAGVIAFAALFMAIIARVSLMRVIARARCPGISGVPWVSIVLILALAIAVFVVGGGQQWIVVLALAAAACGRFTASIRPATFAAASCVVAGLVVGVHDNLGEGYTATVLIVPPLAAFYAYNAGRRIEMVATLRQTRAELARIVVSEERLRIARDLHDLLGHSLSLITLKAELSRRMMSTDTERAARELADLETVARQSLSDVRAAVAGYRQPDLAAELAAARQLLTAAGVACRITAPEHLDLPADADTVLAWAIREGITNVVRHARATSAAITVTSTRKVAIAEITDDGPGPAADLPAGPAAPASTAPGNAGAASAGPGGVDEPASTAPGTAEPGGAGPGNAGVVSAGPGNAGVVSAAPGGTSPGSLGPGRAGAAGAGSASGGLATAMPVSTLSAGTSHDGAVPAAGLARIRLAGSGLAGLAERVRALGGDMAAGRLQPRGFRLRVTVPLRCEEP